MLEHWFKKEGKKKLCSTDQYKRKAVFCLCCRGSGTALVTMIKAQERTLLQHNIPRQFRMSKCSLNFCPICLCELNKRGFSSVKCSFVFYREREPSLPKLTRKLRGFYSENNRLARGAWPEPWGVPYLWFITTSPNGTKCSMTQHHALMHFKCI